MRAFSTRRSNVLAVVGGLAAVTLGLSACASPNAESAATGDAEGPVTLVVHDSFGDAEAFAEAASAATGVDVSVVTAGDGGELTNKLVLTQGAPIADAFFGVDHAFASRLVSHEVAAPFVPAALPESALPYTIGASGMPGEVDGGEVLLAPVDQGATCINIDPAWFAERQIAEPESLEDLTREEYRGLSVLIDPLSSSTGAAFLIGTVAAFGEEGYESYWEALVANDVRIEQGWSDAYNGQFTQGGGDGEFPIVLSYSSSPAWTVTEDGTASTTVALLDTCTTQVEYAGVLAGTERPEAAAAVVNYLLSAEFQQSIPDTMYMYPVDDEVAVPEEWAQFAPMPATDQVHDLSPAAIESGREEWLKRVSDILGL